MPGPLASMFANIKSGNDQDFSRFRRQNPEWDSGDYGRGLFNSQLSRLSRNFRGGRMPDDDGGPIVLGGEGGAPAPEPMYFEAMSNPRPQAPVPFRDPAQAGPAPPADPRILARMFGGK